MKDCYTTVATLKVGRAEICMDLFDFPRLN